MKAREKELFQQLAFCWQHFEDDGLNEEILSEFLYCLTNSILVVGSGQGLVSQLLRKHFSEVHSLDASKEMAKYAKIRRDIDTEVADFVKTDKTKKYSSIVVNTGVVCPGLLGAGVDDFSGALSSSLINGGNVFMTFFERSMFDDFVDKMSLNRSKAVISKLWSEIEKGRTISDALIGDVGEGFFTDYHRLLYADDLSEYEKQFQDAGREYRKMYPEGDTEQFISNCMGYVSYGLDFSQQQELMSSLESSGLKVEAVATRKKVRIVTLIKNI